MCVHAKEGGMGETTPRPHGKAFCRRSPAKSVTKTHDHQCMCDIQQQQNQRQQQYHHQGENLEGEPLQMEEKKDNEQEASEDHPESLASPDCKHALPQDKDREVPLLQSVASELTSQNVGPNTCPNTTLALDSNNTLATDLSTVKSNEDSSTRSTAENDDKVKASQALVVAVAVAALQQQPEDENENDGDEDRDKYEDGEDEKDEDEDDEDDVHSIQRPASHVYVQRKPHPEDVLMGKGKPVVMHPGNKQFRIIVEKYFHAYDSRDQCRLRSDRHQLVKQVYGEVEEKGGQFLRFVGNQGNSTRKIDNPDEPYWEVVQDRNIIYKKIKQLFRQIRVQRTRSSSSPTQEKKETSKVKKSYKKRKPKQGTTSSKPMGQPHAVTTQQFDYLERRSYPVPPFFTTQTPHSNNTSGKMRDGSQDGDGEQGRGEYNVENSDAPERIRTADLPLPRVMLPPPRSIPGLPPSVQLMYVPVSVSAPSFGSRPSPFPAPQHRLPMPLPPPPPLPPSQQKQEQKQPKTATVTPMPASNPKVTLYIFPGAQPGESNRDNGVMSAVPPSTWMSYYPVPSTIPAIHNMPQRIFLSPPHTSADGQKYPTHPPLYHPVTAAQDAVHPQDRGPTVAAPPPSHSDHNARHFLSHYRPSLHDRSLPGRRNHKKGPSPAVLATTEARQPPPKLPSAGASAASSIAQPTSPKPLDLLAQVADTSSHSNGTNAQLDSRAARKRLRHLEELRDALTPEEYQAKRRDILNRL